MATLREAAAEQFNRLGRGTLPEDAVNDYRLVTPTGVKVGDTILVIEEVTGTVTSVADLGPFLWLTLNDKGVITSPFIPNGPLEGGLIGYRYGAYKRRAKPPAGTAPILGTDGSKWIYPDDGTGKYRCYFAGTVHKVGELGERARFEGADSGLTFLTDPLFDWEPVTNGAAIVARQTYIVTIEVLQTVTAVAFDGQLYTVTTTGGGGGWVGTADQLVTVAGGYKVRRFKVTPKPAVDARFAGADGSRWIYAGDAGGALFCWRSGVASDEYPTPYAAGAAFLRGDITVTLRGTE